MTDTLSLAGSSATSPDSTPTTEPAKPKRKWPRALLAGFLSLLFPGTGQLLNRQPRKAFLFAMPVVILRVLLTKTGLLLTFSTMAPLVLFSVAWQVFVAAEAVYTAATGKPRESSVPMPWLTYSLLALALSVPAILFDPKKDLPIRAFSIPSGSMCPTICIGERIVAGMHAYQSHAPQRGDLIMLQHPSSPALFDKRVIGLPGDTVAPGPDGSILVSGQPFVSPPPCADPSARPPHVNPDDYAGFHSTVVPDGTYFVVGDNLANSFDSRIPEFGPVTADMLRGKPLYIYWSPNLHRIGCQLR